MQPRASWQDVLQARNDGLSEMLGEVEDECEELKMTLEREREDFRRLAARNEQFAKLNRELIEECEMWKGMVRDLKKQLSEGKENE